jgi:hypothetical protein
LNQWTKYTPEEKRKKTIAIQSITKSQNSLQSTKETTLSRTSNGILSPLLVHQSFACLNQTSTKQIADVHKQDHSKESKGATGASGGVHRE